MKLVLVYLNKNCKSVEIFQRECMLNCIYSLVFNVSAAGLYQENKNSNLFTLLSQSVHNPQMFSMFLISFYDVHTVQIWRVSVASPCALVDGSGVKQERKVTPRRRAISELCERHRTRWETLKTFVDCEQTVTIMWISLSFYFLDKGLRPKRWKRANKYSLKIVKVRKHWIFLNFGAEH